MLYFILGLFVGCSLGVFFTAILSKSKETDEPACRFIQEKEGISQGYVPVSH